MCYPNSECQACVFFFFVMKRFSSHSEGTKASTSILLPMTRRSDSYSHSRGSAQQDAERGERQREERALSTTGAVAALPTHLELHSRLFEFTVEQASCAEVDEGVFFWVFLHHHRRRRPLIFPSLVLFSSLSSSARLVVVHYLECLCCGLTRYETFLAYGNDLQTNPGKLFVLTYRLVKQARPG